MIAYEAELTWEPSSTCYGWRYVVYRVEGDDRVVVAVGGNYSTREVALGLAQEQAEKDRGVRVFDPITGRSYNIFVGTNPGTKRREVVALDI